MERLFCQLSSLRPKCVQSSISRRNWTPKIKGNNMHLDRISQALALSIQAHDGQTRKGTTIPYISHPMAVASIALEYGADEDQTIAALLHDAVEDGGPHYADRIKELFGERVVNIVLGCTDGVPDTTGKKEAWRPRKERYIAHLKEATDDVLLVSGADKLHNARAIASDLQSVGLAVFERFTATMSQTLWYYETLADVFIDRDTPIAQALKDTVQHMKQLVRQLEMERQSVACHALKM